MIELRSYSACSAGGRVGLFDLTEYLSFADHHRIEAGSNSENVAHGVFVAKFVNMGIEFSRRKMEVLAHKSTQVGRSVDGVGDHLHAVTGGKNQSLLDPRMRGKLAAGFGQMRFGDGQALAHVERGTGVVHADELISHEAANP